MTDTTAIRPPAPLDTRAIRRRVQREYLVLTAPAFLDGDAASRLLDAARMAGENVDVVVDLRAVEHCTGDVLPLLADASEALRDRDLTVTLSHPSPAVEALLSGGLAPRPLAVRRARHPRPLRHSMRGEVGQI